VSSNFTKQLCASVAREWWQQEALRTAEALDQLAREGMFESTWWKWTPTRFALGRDRRCRRTEGPTQCLAPPH
jgi:hypothetical protein